MLKVYGDLVLEIDFLLSTANGCQRTLNKHQSCFRLYKFMKWKYLEYWIYSWYSGLYISIEILHKVEIVTKSRYFIQTASDELACGGSIQSDMFVAFRFGVNTNIACHIWFGISKLDISLSNRTTARVTYFIATSVQIKTNR